MVISLYICEIPQNIFKKDIDNIFSELEGYIDSRIKVLNDKRKIAFIDYETEKDAKFAMETLQGFRFAEEDKGLIIKVSDNTKQGINQGNNPNNSNTNRVLNKKRHSESRSLSRERYHRERSRTPERNFSSLPSSKPVQPSQTGNQNILDLLNILSTIPSNSTPVSNMPSQNTNKPYTINPVPSHNEPTPSSDPNSINNILECLQNLQTVQLLSSLTNQQDYNKSFTQPIPKPAEVASHSQSSSFYNKFIKHDDYFRDNLKFRKNATNIVYVEGMPLNVTEREVAHIFRPFQGFKSVRLVSRDKNGEKSIICFADFETVTQSTVVINTLQGYRFDKNDLIGLHFSYGVSKNK
jgi:hypothetical protein